LQTIIYDIIVLMTVTLAEVGEITDKQL